MTKPKRLEHFYKGHPCEDRYRPYSDSIWMCLAGRAACYHLLRDNRCPKAFILPETPPEQKTLPIAATTHTVTFLRDIPAGTYRLVKEG